MEYDSEYSELFDGMTDEVKQVLQLAMSNFAPDENNIDDFRDSVENTIQQLGEYFKNNPEDITIAISPDTSMNVMDFQAARQEFLQNMINAFGGNVETLTDEQIKIICEFGFIWDGETKTFTDTYDSMQQIFEQGLYSKVKGGMGNLEKIPFTVNEAAKAYQVLNNAAEDALFTQEQLYGIVVESEYAEKSLTQLANEYESFSEYSDELTDSEKKRFEIIKSNLDTWADRLGVVKGNYDEIAKAAKAVGDLSYGGFSSETPSSFQEKYQDYEKLYNYLVNDFNGAWDTDMLSIVESNSELAPFINNIETMETMVKEMLDNGEAEYGKVWAAQLATTEEGTKTLLDYNSALVDDFADNYNIDLRNFTTLKEAETQLDAFTTATMESNWLDAQIALGNIYADDLKNFTDAQSAKLGALASLLTMMGEVGSLEEGMTKANALTVSKTTERGGQYNASSAYNSAYNDAYQSVLDKYGVSKNNASSKIKLEASQAASKAAQEAMSKNESAAIDAIENEYWEKYTQKQYGDTMDRLKAMQEEFQEIGNNFSVNTSGFSNAASGSGSSGDDDIESAKKYLEELQELQNQINKEWEDMVAFANNTDSAYYGKMRENLTAQLEEVNRLLENYDEYLAAGMLEESDYNDLMQQRIDLQVEINNLDDEQVQEAIDLLETQDASIVSLIEAQKQLIATSDTYEELVERQQELNDLLEQQRELQRDVYEFERDMAEMATEYVSGTAYSNSRIYEAMMSLQKQSVEQQMESLLDSYNTVIAQKMQQYSSEGLSAGEAYNMAYDSEEARDLIQQYWELFQEYGDLVYQEFEDKVNELDGLIEDIESTKSEKWASLKDIAPYYETLVDYIELKLDQIEKALENTSNMTDEQIQDWVDQYNDAIQQLRQAQEDQLQDTIDYQEETFSALTSWVQEQIDALQDLQDTIDDEYQPLIDDINDYNDAVDRTNELLELQQNLKDSLSSKERVYREGIGWVCYMPMINYIG